jgi:hypothetical protein
MKNWKYEILIEAQNEEVKDWSTQIMQVKDLKIWDLTRIYNSDSISGATDKGMNTKAHDVGNPEAWSGSVPWEIGLV